MKGQSNDEKKYLERIKRLDKLIDRKLDKAARLYSLATKITPTMSESGGGGSGNQDKVSAAMDKWIDLNAEINRDVEQLADMQSEAYELLYKISNQEYYDVLEMHYLQYMTFEQIGAKKGCSRRWAEKLHGRALEVFGKILKAQE
ncbi:MAG: hypothetical protein J6M47_02590 [Clostridia bacterium]|nr:hypothetical protein [Clostridia bacterium]